MRRVNRNVCGTNRSCGLLASAVLFAAVAGCTSSDGGGSLAPSGGQNPDPVVLDFPIAYIKRPVPAADLPASDARELLDFQPGADLYVRDRASPSASDRNVTTEITLGEGDVRDVEPSYDGTRLVFAMREPLIEGADEEDQPTWNIWEYDTTAQQLRRVIQSDIVAEEGHDIAPHYLPDGRIVFTSTRQRQSRAILLDEGKPQFAADDEDRREPAFVLHVMNADGTGLRQISFNQSHDIDPAVLDDGRIVFSRWENAGPNNEINLYTVRPDGSQLELLYGAQSHATGTDGADVHFLEP
ncbi:MAG: alpha protein, partial [Pseudomonadota bacterium]|nr:alpha protein [Pseudomonadota bacterium]